MESGLRAQLLIVGNGLDISAGLESSTVQFFNNRYNRTEFQEHIIDCCKTIQGGNIFPSTWDDDNNRVTIWDVLFHDAFYQNQDGGSAHWADIEAAILDYVENIENLVKACLEHNNHIPSSASMGIANIVRSRYRSLYDNAKLYVRGYHYDLGRAARDCLLQELKVFESSYCDYLEARIESNPQYASSVTRKVYSLLEELYEVYLIPRVCSVLSFNYTEPTLRYPKVIFRVKNVHGTLREKNIVFGVDGQTNESELLEFTKTFRTIAFSGIGYDLFLDEIDIIKIYGHSLGVADYSYFQSIFDRVNLFGSNVRLVFFTYPGQNRNTFQIKVANLLAAYGNTLDNKDHGKNLMHKLLLEERLSFHEL